MNPQDSKQSGAWQPKQPSATPSLQEPQTVYIARPSTPVQPPISPEVEKLHRESVKKYPQLNLSAGEYVISDVRRHPIGLVAIWGVVALIVVLMFAFLPFYAANQESIARLFLISPASLPSAAVISVPFLIALGLFVLGGFIATIVYVSNRFYLTNESVIQHIRHSLFVKNEQTISLLNIEDASFSQHGILPHLLNYGSLRLSTEGDETTYRFHYVSSPKTQVSKLNDAVEAFKHGRPFGDEDQ